MPKSGLLTHKKRSKSSRTQASKIQISRRHRLKTTEDKINAESELGRTIFGPIPVGHQREFFEHRKNIWIWYESWTELGVEKGITIRYEVRPSGVYKAINSGSYTKITGQELDNFRRATHRYLQLIKTNLYHTV